MYIVMKLDGIDGASRAKGHEKGIIVQSFQWGAGRGLLLNVLTFPIPCDAGAACSEVTLSKVWDTASLPLLDACVNWQPELSIRTATIDFVEFRAGNPFSFLRVVLHGAVICAYSMSSDGHRPTEVISICYSKIAVYDLANADSCRIVFEFDWIKDATR